MYNIHHHWSSRCIVFLKFSLRWKFYFFNLYSWRLRWCLIALIVERKKSVLLIFWVSSLSDVQSRIQSGIALGCLGHRPTNHLPPSFSLCFYSNMNIKRWILFKNISPQNWNCTVKGSWSLTRIDSNKDNNCGHFKLSTKHKEDWTKLYGSTI